MPVRVDVDVIDHSERLVLRKIRPQLTCSLTSLLHERLGHLLYVGFVHDHHEVVLSVPTLAQAAVVLSE